MWNVVGGSKILSDVPFWMLAIKLVSDKQHVETIEKLIEMTGTRSFEF